MAEFLTVETFKEQIMDFEKNEEWNYKGTEPCIIDFYADWCQPCKMVAPILDELSNEYNGKVKIYKINTEEQPELSNLFGIRSIPSLLFVPLNDKPQMSQGAMSKSEFKRIIKEIFNVE